MSISGFFRRKIVIGISIIVVIGIVIIVMAGRKNDRRTEVQTGVAGKMFIRETVTATGRIEPRTQVKISADVAAKIIHLGVKEGDWVEKDDLLVRLDQERYVAAMEQAEANLRSVRANANLAQETLAKVEKDFERMKTLVDQNLESRANYDQAWSSVQVEKARYQSALELVDQAQATVKQAKDNLSKTTIYSPMAGTISALNKEAGEITLGSQFQEDVIMIVSNLTEMEALVNVDENDIVNVSLGDSAEIEIDALPDKIFKGLVREIASSANTRGQGTTEQKTEFEVKLSITDAVPDLRPGMTASADITIETRDDAVCVPLQCVTVRTPEQLKDGDASKKNGSPADSSQTSEFKADKDGFIPLVFVVENGMTRAVQVETGIQSDTHIEILSGVADGDVIVTGSYRAISQTLRNHMNVLVKETASEEQ